MRKGFQTYHFWNFPAFTSAMFKDGGRQYKGHNIPKAISR